MRQEFIECRSRATAWSRCPWAAIITKTEGGFMTFESIEDYKTWLHQR